jgi:hypothetical protein
MIIISIFLCWIDFVSRSCLCLVWILIMATIIWSSNACLFQESYCTMSVCWIEVAGKWANLCFYF